MCIYPMLGYPLRGVVVELAPWLGALITGLTTPLECLKFTEHIWHTPLHLPLSTFVTAEVPGPNATHYPDEPHERG